MFLQLNSTAPTLKDNDLADQKEAMFQKVTSSQAFNQKVSETCFGIESKAKDCRQKATDGVYCTVLLQAAVAVADVDDIASMMGGEMEMHFDEITVPEVEDEVSTTPPARAPFADW